MVGVNEVGIINTNHNLCWLQRLVYIAVDRGLLKFNPLEDVGYEKKGTMPLERTTAPSTGLIMTPFTAMCCGKYGNVPELP